MGLRLSMCNAQPVRFRETETEDTIEVCEKILYSTNQQSFNIRDIIIGEYFIKNQSSGLFISWEKLVGTSKFK
jgi:hypothetical protein